MKTRFNLRIIASRRNFFFWLRTSILPTLALLFFGASTKAQSIDWVLDGVNANQNVTTAVYCDSERVVVCGFFGSLFGSNGTTLQFSNAPILTSRGQSDAFVACINPDKTVNWIKQIGGIEWDYATDAIADTQGNVYLCGLFDDSVWVDNMYLVSEGATDIFLAKFNAAGTLLWLKQIKSPGDQYYYSKLATDNAGNLYLGGAFSTDTDFGDGVLHTFQGGSQLNFPKDAFLCKYDFNGNLLWSNIIQSSETEEITSLTVAPTGEVYACGHFLDSLTFSGVTKVSQGEEDIFLLKYDTSGSLVWVKTYGNIRSDLPTRIVTYGNNNILMSATYEDSITINSTQFFCIPQHNSSLLLAKFDSAGEPFWAKSYAVPAVGAVADINDSGKITFSGAFPINAFLDNFTLTSFDIGHDDVFVAICDSNGFVNKVFQGGMGQLDEYMHDLDMDEHGNIYAVGVPNTEVLWGTELIQNSFFLVKISQEEEGEPASISRNTMNDFSVYPNPTSGVISWQGPNDVQAISVYDMWGRLLISDHGEFNSIDLSKLSTGIYLLQVKTSAGVNQVLITKQ